MNEFQRIIFTVLLIITICFIIFISQYATKRWIQLRKVKKKEAKITNIDRIIQFAKENDIPVFKIVILLVSTVIIIMGATMIIREVFKSMNSVTAQTNVSSGVWQQFSATDSIPTVIILMVGFMILIPFIKMFTSWRF